MSGPPLSEGCLPPWDCSIIHFASDHNHTDVLLRCSHMIGDGQLFMQLLRDILDEDCEAELDDAATITDGGADDGASVASDCSFGGASVSGASSCGGSSVRGGGTRCSSPLIRAVHHQNSAFLPPPSVERAARHRELQRKRQEQRMSEGRGKRGGGMSVGRVRRFIWK